MEPLIVMLALFRYYFYLILDFTIILLELFVAQNFNLGFSLTIRLGRCIDDLLVNGWDDVLNDGLGNDGMSMNGWCAL